ncbi:TPA: hypothetical protein J1W43_003791 [Escherichia coli]|nr:hypothetical protein [Escherichia coli]HBA8269878.1 hypothetical protein [Escherichia coli]HBA8732726.1 hypothetical protein [Escherichia coli]HBB8628812.1 hypothetical protein [Escherichia coli]
MNYSANHLWLMVLLFFISLNTTANDLIVMKHEYGRRGWDGEKYEKASIYPLPEQYPRYSVSDAENIKTKRLINVVLDLSITKERDSILAVVRLKNNSNKHIFIREIEFSALSMNFLITTDNILLKYLGGRFDYGGNFDRNDWVELYPGKMISLTQKLNDNYEFLPGKRLYNIGSLEYSVVNEQWFIERSIFKNLISVISPETNSCNVRENTPLVLKERWLCLPDYGEREVSLEKLLKDLEFYTFDTIDVNNSFRIRTNQVLVEIDAGKISSLYEKRN